MENKSTKIIALIAVIAALCSAGAAILSAISSNNAYEYTKAINTASVSLLDVNVTVERTSLDSVSLKFLFIFENTGNETLRISSISASYFDFNTHNFSVIYEDHAILNRIHPGAVFNQPVNSWLTPIDKDLSNKEVERRIPEWTKLSILMKIKFSSIAKTDSVTYFMGYKGMSKTYQLSKNEYDKMKPFLPPRYKISEL